MSSAMDANMDAQEVSPDSTVDRREGNIANTDDAKALASGEGQLCSSPESSKKKKKDSGKKAKKTAEKHASKSHKVKNKKAKKVTIASPDTSSDDSSDDQTAWSSSDDSTESEAELPDVKKKLSQKKRQNIHQKASKKTKTKSKKLKKPSKVEQESSDDSTSDTDSDSDANAQLAEDQNAAIAPMQQQFQDLQQQVQQMQRQFLSMNLGNNSMLPMTGLNGASFNANALGAGGLGGGLGAGSFGSGGLNSGFNSGFNSGYHDDLDIMMGRPPPGRGGARNRRIVLPPPGGDRNRRGSNPLGGEGLFDNGGESSSLGSKNSKGGKAGAQRLEFKRVDQVWDSQIHNYKLQDTAEGTINSSYDGFLFHVRRTFDWEGKYKATVVDIKSKALREALQDVMGNIKGVSLVEETPKLDPNMLFL